MTNTTGYCAFSDYLTVNCSQPDEPSCTAVSGCTYDFSSKACMHSPDWSAAETGLFAVALILGGMIGPLVAGKLADKVGRRWGVILVGLIGLISCAMMTGARVAGSYGLLIAARVVLGISSGSACVVSPMYVEEMAPPRWSGPIGSVFQIAITLGMAIAAAAGYGLDPTNRSSAMQMEMRFHILIGIQWLLTLIMMAVSWIMPESDGWLTKKEELSRRGVGSDRDRLLPRSGSNLQKDYSQEVAKSGGFPVRQLLVPLIAGIFLASATQLTGINGIMNYAPVISKKTGLPALLGNLAVMLWNFFCTLLSIPIASKFAPRPIYLVGTVGASFSCLLCGIALFPGVVEAELTRHALVGTGIALFVLFFETTMGPSFYYLAQRLFPVEHRSIGAGFTVMMLFLTNALVNFLFPIAAEALSGGPSQNQNKGLALVFIIFGCTGVVCDSVLFKTLRVDESDAGVETEQF